METTAVGTRSFVESKQGKINVGCTDCKASEQAFELFRKRMEDQSLGKRVAEDLSRLGKQLSQTSSTEISKLQDRLVELKLRITCDGLAINQFEWSRDFKGNKMHPYSATSEKISKLLVLLEDCGWVLSVLTIHEELHPSLSQGKFFLAIRLAKSGSCLS